MDPSAWIGQPTEVLRAVAERARSQAGDLPLGVVAWGETARSLPDLSEIVDADFAVALSALALEPIEGLDRLARPVLFAYGVDDATYAGHGHASALNEAVGAAGMDRATIRVFLGADRDLLVPVTRASLQPTRIAPGWIDLFTSWIRDATAAE